MKSSEFFGPIMFLHQMCGSVYIYIPVTQGSAKAGGGYMTVHVQDYEILPYHLIYTARV